MTRRLLFARAARAGTGAAAALVAAGCGWFDRDDGPIEPDALEPLLAGTLVLTGRYDAALAVAPQLAATLTPIRDNHRAHADELARMIGATPTTVRPGGSATASTAPAQPALVADLLAAETQARDEAVAACLAAPGERTPLLGSMAACRATHIEALR